MDVTTVGFLIDEKRAALESKIKKSGVVDDFDIEDLDKADNRKDVMITFKEPVDSKFLQETLHSIFGEAKTKHMVEG